MAGFSSRWETLDITQRSTTAEATPASTQRLPPAFAAARGKHDWTRLPAGTSPAGWTLNRENDMTTKTRTQALAFALRLSIAADTNERSQQALEIAKELATGMTAKQVASAKRMAAIL